MSTMQIDTLQAPFASFFDEVEKIVAEQKQKERSKQLINKLSEENKKSLNKLCNTIDGLLLAVTDLNTKLEIINSKIGSSAMSFKNNSVEVEAKIEDWINLIEKNNKVSLSNIPNLKHTSRTLSFQRKVDKFTRALKKLNKTIQSTQALLNKEFIHDEWDRQMYRDIESGRFEATFPLEESDNPDPLYERINKRLG